MTRLGLAWSPEVPLDGGALLAVALEQIPEVQEMAAMAGAIEHKRYIATHGEDMPEIRTGGGVQR